MSEEDLKIPPEYEGGEQLLIAAQDKKDGKKDGEKILEEDQKKQIEEARKHVEEVGGFIFKEATLYPGFSVAFKPGTVHSLADVKNVTTEPASGAVFASKVKAI